MSEIEKGRIARPMREWEVREARVVFGDQLDYSRVRICEQYTWTDLADKVGRWVKKLPPPGEHDHNAITLGNQCYFPIVMLPDYVPLGDAEEYKLGWMMHELTHAYQYQRLGWRYLYLALSAQIRLGAQAYQYGGPEVLRSFRQTGWTFHTFNLEQQGDIVRDYYWIVRSGGDASAYIPYIQDIQKTTELPPYR